MNLQAFGLSAPHHEWSLIRLQATDEHTMTRPSLHLCLLLDVSASMEEDGRLEHVKHSLHHLLGLLTPADQISLITFSEEARVVLHQAFVADVEALRLTLCCLQTESSTNLEAGLERVQRVLLRDPGQKQCILLLTDGFATSGVTDMDTLLRRTEALVDGSVIHVVGYGEEHHVELLSRMATVGGGSYHVVRSLEDVAIVMGDVVGGLVSCAFQEVTLTLPACDVKTRYHVTVQTDELGMRNTQIMIGDLMAHGEAVVLARLPVGSAFHVDAWNRATGVMETFWVQVMSDARHHAMGATHWLRWEVVETMEAVSRHLETFGSPGSLSHQAYRYRVSQMLAAVREARSHAGEADSDSERALWDLLIHELTLCQRMLEGHGNSSVLLRQHGATLSMMRGISARTDSVNEDSWAHEVPPYVPALTRAFSNATQRHWSDQLVQASQESTGLPFHRPSLIHATSVNSFQETQDLF